MRTIYEATEEMDLFKYVFRFVLKGFSNISKSGTPAGGEELHPHRNRKNVVEKWYYFPELYKKRQVLEDGREMLS